MGMRDHLAHGYFTTDLGKLWKAIHEDLPDLQTAVEKELSLSAIDLTKTSDT